MNIIFVLLMSFSVGLGYCAAEANKLPHNIQNECILNLHHSYADPGGIEMHLLLLNKFFLQHGIKNFVLTSNRSTWLKQTLDQQGDGCEAFDHDGFPTEVDIMLQCLKHPVTTIICNFPIHVYLSHQVKKALQGQRDIKIVFVVHDTLYEYSPQFIAMLNHVDGVVTVNYAMAETAKALAKQGVLVPKNIEWIAPFWDDLKFLHFVTQQERRAFFKGAYGIDVPNTCPVITMIANFWPYKNHDVLLHAIAQLRTRRGKEFKVILAGDGQERAAIEGLAQSLQLQNCVYFLGSVSNVAELLHHSTLHLLSSGLPDRVRGYAESFGIVYLEAALMKKPFLGASGVGIIPLVNEGVTDFAGLRGLSFASGDVQSLADMLEFLLDHPAVCQKMGENAYNFVKQEFLSEAIFNKWARFLNGL